MSRVSASVGTTKLSKWEQRYMKGFPGRGEIRCLWKSGKGRIGFYERRVGDLRYISVTDFEYVFLDLSCKQVGELAERLNEWVEMGRDTFGSREYVEGGS